MLTYKFKADQAPTRADLVITGHLPQLSRAYVKQLADQGKLLFNDQPVAAGFKLKSQGTVKLDYDPAELLEVPELPLEIIFEDQQLLVINKPPGVISHSRGRFWAEASVASSIRSKLQFEPANTNQRSGLVHRLDRATSGLLICAKNQLAMAKLQAQFKHQTVSKSYLAIIEASHLPPVGLIDKPIARNPARPTSFQVDGRGKPAQTKFKRLESYRNYSWLKLQPKTGRTHQLRVHLASLGQPIVGDQIYAGAEAPRLMLHAHHLSFKHPSTGKKLKLTAGLPPEFEEYRQ